MSGLAAAVLYAIPALVWAAMAQAAWHVVRRSPPRTLFRLFGLEMTAMAAYYAAGVLLALTPPDASVLRNAFHGVGDVSLIAFLAFLPHVLSHSGFRGQLPRMRSIWVVVHYATAVVVAAVVIHPPLVPAPTLWVRAFEMKAAVIGGSPLLPAPLAEVRRLASRIVFYTYVLDVLCLTVWQMRRLANRGAWQPGGLGEVRRPDLVVAAVGLAVVVGLLIAVATHGRMIGSRIDEHGLHGVLSDVLLGLGVAVPFFVRLVNDALPRLLTDVETLASASALYLGMQVVAARPALAGLAPLVDVVAVLALVLALGPGRALTRAAIDRVVLRRSRWRREDLRAFLHTLSPELGAHECCRRALAELVRAFQIPGAAILLHDGATAVHGAFMLAPIAGAWPRGPAADALPTRPFGSPDFWDLPLSLQEALNEANVVGVVPIVSPRRRWGHLFATARHLAAIYSDEDIRTAEEFAAQLALVLDATELLTRAVAVERSLAHAEKLAAIGETAARIAHEIRNPVTAARSLAQQLARDPMSPANTEAAQLILGELERVERQVAALLRFSRREEYRFAPVDLGGLARGTVAALHPRLDAAGIELALDVAEGITARADAEKLRQVLVNLIDNAIDALGDVPAPRRLAVVVGGVNGTAMLRLTDSGAGVPADALPHLFEPFFSRKEKGTGLGLAIARRTVDAHGGRIEATCEAGHGMTFRIELPLARGDG
jgi:signal transduction histidine kinase